MHIFGFMRFIVNQKVLLNFDHKIKAIYTFKTLSHIYER